MKICDDLERFFQQHPDVLFGVSKLDYSSYGKDYKCSLVLAVPHSERLTLETYTEEAFENQTIEARARMKSIMVGVLEVLNRNGVLYYLPEAAQNSEETLTAEFSFKYAAANAGIGWIGKNDVLITEQYGANVALYAILLDCDIPIEKAVLSSRCPEDCNVCTNACLYDALKDKKWSNDLLRNDLIDFELCNKQRSLYIKTHKRKNACGFCMVACPVGLH